MDSVGYPEFDARVSGPCRLNPKFYRMGIHQHDGQLAPAGPWGELTGSLEPLFETNVGQAHPHVRFLSRGRGAQLFLTNHEAVLRFGTSTSAMLRLRLLGANAHVEPSGLDPLAGHSNYFVGSDPRNWHRSVAQFGRVIYPEVYPGIDLAFHSAGATLSMISSCSRAALRRSSRLISLERHI